MLKQVISHRNTFFVFSCVSFQALALSTAALLFMLSRDRQMEINKSTLQLLLRLLDPFDKDDPDSDSSKQGMSVLGAESVFE